MKFARVLGTVVATQKYRDLEGIKFLLVQPLNEYLRPTGLSEVAADPTAQSARGELVSRVASNRLVVNVADDVDAVPAPLRSFDVELLPPRRLVFRFRRSETRIGEIIDALHDLGLIIADLSTEEGSLEDIFLQLIHAPSEPGEGD